MARNLSAPLILFACLACSTLSLTEARDIMVGGKKDAWKIPSSKSQSLNHWAERVRFVIGDSLVWKYDGEKDSVLQVSKDDYATCNTTNYIKEYKDGYTKVELDHSGAFYFISGAEGNCQKGQKLIVVVLSPRHRYPGISPGPSSAVGSQLHGPDAAPTSGAPSFHGVSLVLLGLGVVLMR